jgi:CRP-like cAMP-binding protein
LQQFIQPGVQNRLLAALPADEFARLQPRLRAVELPFKQSLYEPDQPIGTIYFVQSGVVSLLALLEDGSQLEVAVVGCEGAAGIECVMGTTTSSLHALVQIKGTAPALDAREAQDSFEEYVSFRRSLLRFTQAQQSLIAQTAACNGRHALEQRLARWLLMMHDRVRDDHIRMTHEFMAMMLGVRRPGVTLAIGTLQKAGLIRHGNGHVDVLDRKGLEGAACECYEVVRLQYDKLLRP